MLTRCVTLLLCPKAMTLYLVFEAMSKGEISEDTVITATPTDQAIADIYEISNNKIVAGVDYTVSELITMTRCLPLTLQP